MLMTRAQMHFSACILLIDSEKRSSDHSRSCRAQIHSYRNPTRLFEQAVFVVVLVVGIGDECLAMML